MSYMKQELLTLRVHPDCLMGFVLVIYFSFLFLVCVEGGCVSNVAHEIQGRIQDLKLVGAQLK